MSDKAAIIKEAQKFLARGQIDKAIAEWEKLVKEHPDANTLNTIGDLYIKKGDRDNAIDLFHKSAHIFRQEGFSVKALALYKKILNIKSSDTVSLLSLGELNEGKGLIKDAIKFYLAAADSLSKEGKKEKIFEIYNKIVDLSPGNLPLRNKVAEVYIKEGLRSEAANEYLHIANLYVDKQEIEKSIEYFRKVLDIQPVKKEAIMGIINLYEITGNLEQATEQVEDAVNLFPEDLDILIRCAEINIIAERFDEAREYLRRATEIEPANLKSRRLLGDIYIKEGDREKAWTEYLPVLDEILLDEKYDDAIELLESFKDVDPIETGKRLVSLYMQLGEHPQIIRELTVLGDIYFERGKQREALNCYKEAFKMSPDDESLSSKVVELEREVGLESISIDAEKTIDEVIADADIYIKYGLYENAKNLLDALKLKDPENIDLHQRLKSLYIKTGEKEQAVSECLILDELYKKTGDIEKSDQMIKEVYEIFPEDPRLIDREIPAVHEEEIPVAPPQGPSIEDYSEEIAEADFYSRQGLIDEAREILERLQNIFPENEEIRQKLASLGQMIEAEEKTEEIKEEKEEPFITQEEFVEAEEIAEPALDSDVLDIFNEFKKGLEKELEEEDYETHYNLGIAYKEMGLIDDAIREFQSSIKDPKKFVSSSNMLGVCYTEKGIYSLAIDVLKTAVTKMEDRGESYLAMKYDLAEAYEKNGNIKEALDYYTEVYGWNSKFRAVSDKINQLRAMVGESAEQKKPKDRKDRVSYI
ncbi:MAG: tetratricopeptide repeat protein [Nitrospirae bacterium]|jgi:tetratricopeptide (TPR) repeat protein|nr:tetratricopeptide repeat protein [Nitrospirota bacterium]